MTNLFDKKDIFTWANAEKAKEFIGKECYFADDFDELDAEIKKNITYNLADVNVSSIWSFKTNIVGSYAICLLADKVIKEEPKYRPFKDLSELANYLDAHDLHLVGKFLNYRNKKNRQEYIGMISGVSLSDNRIFLNGWNFSLKDLFYNFEWWNGDKWISFGVLEE